MAGPNLDVSQSIIAAYAQGKKEAFDREKNAQEQEQQKLDNEDRIKKQKEQRKQFEESLKQEKQFHDDSLKLSQSQFKLQQTIAQQQFIKEAEASGNAPPGFTVMGKEQREISPGVFGYVNFAKNNETGETIEYREPQTVNKQKVIEGIEQRAPLNTEEKDMLKYKAKLDEELAHLSSLDKLDNEKILGAQERAWKSVENAKDRALAIQLATEKHATDIFISGNKANAQGYELWNDYPMDEYALKVFGGEPGDTFAEVIGKAKLTQKGKNDLKTSMELEPLIIETLDSLDEILEDGKSGYDRYFVGSGVGQVKDFVQKLPGQADPWVEGIRPQLGRIFVEGKKLAELGAVVSKQEERWLRSYTPGAERSLTPDRARAIMGKLLPALWLNRVNTIRTQGTRFNSNATGSTIRLSNSDTIRPNLNTGVDIGGGFSLEPDEVK